MRNSNQASNEPFTVITPDSIFRGMSYGDWLVTYMNWVVGPAPDSFSNDNILYLRGSARGQSYRESSSKPTGSGMSLLDPNIILDKTGLYGYTITKDTAVMFSPLFSFFSVNYRYGKKVLGSVDEVHNAAILEMNNSPFMFANLFRIEQGTSQGALPNLKHLPLFNNGKDLNSHLVESPIFKLFVPSDSLLADKLDPPLELNREYDDVILYGCFIILQFNVEGKYRIDFGGIGDNSYATRSVYDIEVIGENQSRIKDESDLMRKKDNLYPQTGGSFRI